MANPSVMSLKRYNASDERNFGIIPITYTAPDIDIDKYTLTKQQIDNQNKLIANLKLEIAKNFNKSTIGDVELENIKFLKTCLEGEINCLKQMYGAAMEQQCLRSNRKSWGPLQIETSAIEDETSNNLWIHKCSKAKEVEACEENEQMKYLEQKYKCLQSQFMNACKQLSCKSKLLSSPPSRNCSQVECSNQQPDEMARALKQQLKCLSKTFKELKRDYCAIKKKQDCCSMKTTSCKAPCAFHKPNCK